MLFTNAFETRQRVVGFFSFFADVRVLMNFIEFRNATSDRSSYVSIEFSFIYWVAFGAVYRCGQPVRNSLRLLRSFAIIVAASFVHWCDNGIIPFDHAFTLEIVLVFALVCFAFVVDLQLYPMMHLYA